MQRDRVAGPQDPYLLSGAQGSRSRGDRFVQDGAPGGRLLLRDQAEMDSRERARRPGRGGEWRRPLRDRGVVADVVPHRGKGPCDGLLQRGPHDDVQHNRPRMGLRTLGDPRDPGGHAADAVPAGTCVRHHRPFRHRGVGADSLGPRGPAGRAVRPDLLRPRRCEDNLRHRRVPADEHRRGSQDHEQGSPDDRRLERGRSHGVRARRIHIHRGCGSTMAEGRAPDRDATWSLRSSASARRTGIRMPGGSSWV